MKKILMIPTLLLSLSLGACNFTTPNESKDSKDNESSEEDESHEDVYVYLDYPDDKNNFYVPKTATFESHRETTQGTNPDGSYHVEHEFNVIINNDEIYAVMYPGDETHEQMFYMKGRYIPVSGNDYMYTWVYDVYFKAPNQGMEWTHLITGGVKYALAYFYGEQYFNFHYMKDEYSSQKTGEKRTLEGEQLDEYYHSLAGLYVYYSQKDDVIKAYKTFASKESDKYTGRYMSNYQTNAVEITDKPGADVLIA